MEINIYNKNLSNILFKNKEVSIYIGKNQIWPTLSEEAFLNGFWTDDFPWNDNSCWRD